MISEERSLGAVLMEYIERIPGTSGVDARAALTALAFAEAPGFTPQLWSFALNALYGTAVDPDLLATFARSPAANFLVEDSSAGDR